MAWYLTGCCDKFAWFFLSTFPSSLSAQDTQMEELERWTPGLLKRERDFMIQNPEIERHYIYLVEGLDIFNLDCRKPIYAYI